MDCSNCTDQVMHLAATMYSTTQNCEDVDDSCKTKHYTDCTFYKGPNLSCSTIVDGDSLTVALAKIDTQLCSVLGDYSTYNVGCIATGSPILTEQDFVEAISAKVCTNEQTLTTFINTTFVNYSTTVDTRLDNIEVPGITCSSAGIIPTDSLPAVYAKICQKFSTLDSAISLTGINWSQCSTVFTPPETLAEAFSLLIGQVCTAQSSNGVTLPLFNNTGSCLPGTLGAADSLSLTVNKIKERLCTTPSFDINGLNWGCITKPSTTTTDLQAAFQALLVKVNTITQNLPVFESGDFDVDAIDAQNACAGVRVSLSNSPSVDRKVAARLSSTVAGTLEEILVEGIGINLDFTTIANKVVVSSTGGSGGSGDDEKVKASATDSNPSNFLDQKITGASDPSGVTIETQFDAGQNKVVVSPNVDLVILAGKLLEVIKATPDLAAMLCEMMRDCPSPCSAPSNIEISFAPSSTTTTSTTNA